MVFFFKTFYSRCVLFAFPNKLNRLKKQRQEILTEMKEMIDKHIKEVSPEYESNRIIESKSEILDVEKDDIKYLERRFNRRNTTADMKLELELLNSTN